MTATYDLHPEAVAVVQACEKLVDDLRYASYASGARMSISDLKAALPALETVLAEMRHTERLAAVAAAAGAALTHEWVVADSIKCERCNLSVVDHALPIGAVPECGSEGPCAPGARGHLVVSADADGGMYCTYCRTVWQPTAQPEAVAR
jgi:hypothetical protein